MSATKWTVTSTQGQKLYAELDGDTVSMSSDKGNHGQVTLSVWLDKVEQMKKAGYTVETK